MSTIPGFKKTRIAPTPSGFLHLGNALSFAITATLAHSSGASILLRIDDMDKDRVQDRYVQDIFDTLNFLEIPWHEGPRDMAEYKSQYSQLHRMDNFRTALALLRGEGSLFACNCSRTQILKDTAGIYTGTCLNKNIALDACESSWRLHTSKAGIQPVKTLNGPVSAALPAEINNFVVRKKDGYPAYQLASVVDDLHFGIDLVVRGADLWPSTIAQHYIADKLGEERFGNITFYHHALLNAPSGHKLSKSSGDTSIQQLRREGKRPADIFGIISGMLSVDHKAANWKELGEQVLQMQ